MNRASPSPIPRAALALLCAALLIVLAADVVAWWVGPAGPAEGAGLRLPAPFFLPRKSAGTPAGSYVIPLGRAAIRVPILQYHYIRVNPNPSDRLGYALSVTPQDFAAQMDWLAAHGYHPVNFTDLHAYFAGETPLPSRPVILTFDDGYRDFFTTAFPILRAHGFKSVSYLVSGFFGRTHYMTPADVIELQATGLVEFGSHTVTHVDLNKVSAAELAYQLGASKASLTALLGEPVVDFCYPSGKFDQAVVTAVAAARYDTATTELPGVELSWSTRFAWPRVRVAGDESLSLFAKNLGKPEPTVFDKGFVFPTPTPAQPSPPEPIGVV